MDGPTNSIPEELYVVEVDGIRKSEHRIFIEALKRGLELERQYPRSDVKLRDAYNKPQRPTTNMGHWSSYTGRRDYPRTCFLAGLVLSQR